MCLMSNNTIAKEVCGWQPRYFLTEGLDESIEWITKNLVLVLIRFRFAGY